MPDSTDHALEQGVTATALAAVPAAVAEPAAGRAPTGVLGVRLPHVHRYRYAGDDPFSAHSLYRCRCGVVKHGL